MKTWKFWVSLIVASLLAALYLEWLDSGLAGDLWIHVVPVVAGRAIVLILVPAILVGGIGLVLRLLKFPASTTAIFLLATAAWALVVVSNLKVISVDSVVRTSSVTEFAPSGCEYSVSFPGVPDTYMQQKQTADGAFLPLYGAQLVVGKGAGQIRAECVSANGAELKQVSPEDFNAYMTEIAKDVGLSRPSFETQENALGYLGTITGVRDTERGRVTVRIINVIGDVSILTLYLIAFSTDFQTPEMRPFVESVKKI